MNTEIRKPVPVLEILGGLLGIVATVAWTWPLFNSYGPPELFFDQLPGNIIFTVLLLIPFLAAIASALILKAQSRWPVLLSSAILSVVWIIASKIENNFPHAPFPGPSGLLFPPSLTFFFPSAIVLVIAAGLSIRHGKIWNLERRKAVILGGISILIAVILSTSLYVLFLDQGSEFWTRTIPNGTVLPYGEWIRVSDMRHMPQLAKPGLAQEMLNAGVVRPLMALASAELLALGILCLVFIFKVARQSNALSPIVEKSDNGH